MVEPKTPSPLLQTSPRITNWLLILPRQLVRHRKTMPKEMRASYSEMTKKLI